MQRREINLISIAAFTLIELLVVLLIVSIVTTIAVLAFHHFGRDRREKIAIEQLQNMLALARQRAILQPAVLGMVFTKNGYVFYRYWQDEKRDRVEWRRLKEDDLSTATFCGLTAESRNNNTASWMASKAIHPKIIFLPSGEVTPITILLNNKPVLIVSRTGSTMLVSHDSK